MKSLHVRVAHLIDEGKAVAKADRPAAGPYSMNEINFLQDLAIVMIFPGLVTFLFHQLKQPGVPSYIIAGVVIGPHTLPSPLIRDEQTIRTLSKL